VRYGGGIGDRCEQQRRGRLALFRDLERDPGLAHAARPRNGDQPFGRDQPVQRRDLRLAANQRGCRLDGHPGPYACRTGGSASDLALQVG